jgi:hypothetical protein
MKKNEVIRLVRTLSSPEKRYFKLYCSKQSGPKEYLDLFEIICKQQLSDDLEKIESSFNRKYPGKSYENTAQYLLKVITDALVQIGIGNDKWFQQYHSLMRSKILFERSLSKEGYKEIKKAQQLADELQDRLVQFQSHRLGLNYLSESGFGKMEEKDLVELQTKTKNNLRQLHLLQEHSSLYELLRFRLTRSGRSFSREDTEKLNDLLISELSLITRGNQVSFESQKNHLLFQSFFLIHTGQFRSSLKSFSELIRLFEGNKSLWSFPPYDYLFTLEGILDNLRTIGHLEEMGFYIQKIEDLVEQKYPDYFHAIASKTIYIYRLHLLLNTSRCNHALQLIKAIPSALLNNGSVVDYEKRTELLFYIGLTHFYNRDFQKAHKQMGKITIMGKVKENSGAFKVSWLTHLLIHYELDNMTFLEYEIRSYKRAFSNPGKGLKIENLIFKLIKHNPKRKNKASNLKLWKKMEKDIAEISQNSFEKQLLKYYGFDSWIKSKMP